MRLCICGVPRAGKTTMALDGVPESTRYTVTHADDFARLGWSECSARIAQQMDASSLWTIEGVVVVRALRKWLAAHPTGRPCDRVIWLDNPRVPLTKGQETMAKGCRTVWAEVAPLLRARGVDVLDR